MLKSCWFSLWQSRWYVSQLHWTLSFGLLDDREDFKVMSWWPGIYSYYLIKCISRKTVYVYICFQCWYLFIISKQALLHVLLSLTFFVRENFKDFLSCSIDDLLLAGINKVSHLVVVNHDTMRDNMEETMVDSETIVAVQTIIKSVLYVQFCKYMYCLSIYGLFKYSEQSIMIVAVFVNHH